MFGKTPGPAETAKNLPGSCGPAHLQWGLIDPGLGFPCPPAPWFTQGVFLPQMEAQLVELLVLYMAEH